MRLKYLIILLAFAACGPKKQASVIRATDHIRLPMVLTSVVGKREGYSARGTITFIDTSSRDSLVIRFTLEPGVPTKFVRGEYSWKTFQGDVTCSSVDFFGGQGGMPSVGGNFVFTRPDGSAYAVYLPTTEMKNLISPHSAEP
jgi:hypothetical protein